MNIGEELKLYMKTLNLLDESMDAYFYCYDFVNDKIYFTDKIREKYPFLSGVNGISIEEWKQNVYFKDRRRLAQNLNDIRQGFLEEHNMEYRIMDREGNKVWINCRGNVRTDSQGKVVFLIGGISEQTGGKTLDALTGLWNSDKFMQDMGVCLKEGNGYLMVLGIDNFKRINVKKGRAFGNYILKTISDILEETAEFPLRLYRMTGDCFSVIFPGQKQEHVQEFYHNVKTELENYCTISAGAIAYEADSGEDSGSVYQYAENALDSAKKDGKNKLIFFSEKNFKESLKRMELQDELNQAVKNGFQGFYLCYQPQVFCSDFKLYGAEALLRYDSPTNGLVSPEIFIPILEQSELICQVGEWVLKTAVIQCMEWRKSLPDFHINVNISYVQLRQANIGERVIHILKEAGASGEMLTLEVTESIQLQDYSYYNKIFYEWKRHGIKIAIDDFGTGYSSLSYLKSIDVDETKIDRCFVNRIYCNEYNYRLLSNIIELAHSAQIQVCCEGVETEEELITLQELRPDVLQGFLFAKPYRKEEFEKYYIYENSEEYRGRKKRENQFCQMGTEENRKLLEKLRKEEISNIVDGMDEIVYVSDVDTYELYYMNSAGRKLTGIYDYKGQKCYKILQGRNSPCDMCTNDCITNERFYTWERNNVFLEKHFLVKDKLIPWQGKMARLELAIELPSEEKEDAASIDFWSACRKIKPQGTCLCEDILEKTNLGLWIIQMDPKTGRKEMYANDVMRRIMGLDKALSPQECYEHWYSRINEGYYHYINLAMEDMVQNYKTIELQYTWDHPVKGNMLVRCLGVRVEDKDGMIRLQGYHRGISDLERPYFLPGGIDCEIFEYNEKKQAIYFHTNRKMIAGNKEKEWDFPDCWIKDKIVHPHFAEEFREMFHDVWKRENLYGKEMLLYTKNDRYEWFKLKTRHLSNKEKDMNTIVVLMESADRERVMELEYMRKSDFYEVMLSETVAYAEVDVESGHLTMSGGLWETYAEEYKEYMQEIDSRLAAHVNEVVYPDDREKYMNCLNVEYLKKMYRDGVDTQRQIFRRYVHGQLFWMEMVIHVFKDHYSENMYALLYLKNIDAERKRELAQKAAAERDSLTHVYNRCTFEDAVRQYVKEKGEHAKGSLILLDMDDFKQINDKFGHLKGDEILKTLVEILQSVFRKEDLLGRLGGDEFLVFVKNVTDRKIIDGRMELLFEKLKESKGIPLACSAGISTLRGVDFDYADSLGKADIALYKSKEKGKNQYSYYEK